MNANVPTDICFSFTGLVQRGGKTGPHKDGWGIAFYEGFGCRVFLEPYPSHNSDMAKLISRYPIKSEIVISHVRKANRGRICLENTHPFTRELWGRHWTYAHNGQLKGIKKRPLQYYHPVGTTDSEHAFCWIMDQIRRRFTKPPPRVETLWRYIGKLARQVAEHGIFNMLLSDSKHMYAHCSNHMCWITRRAPFGPAQLIDTEVEIDFHEVTTEKDIVTVVATKPLTHNETWNILKKGDFLVLQDGLVHTDILKNPAS